LLRLSAMISQYFTDWRLCAFTIQRATRFETHERAGDFKESWASETKSRHAVNVTANREMLLLRDC
jgi:hypothetical protein